MVRSRLGLKALGLCALVVGLMAFASSAAQAQIGAHWNIVKANGELLKIELGSTLLPKIEIKEIEKNTGELLFTTAGGTKVAILCTEMKVDEGGLLAAHGTVLLKFVFKGCVTRLNGVLSGACKPKGGGAALGEILTEKLKGLILLDKLASGEVDDLVLFTPEDKEGKAQKLFVTLELGEECSIGTLVKVETKGLGEDEGFWIKDCLGNSSFLEEKVEHLLEEGLKDTILALGQPALLDGSVIARLDINGEHKGLKWGGTPA